MKLQLQLDRPLVVFDIESTGVNARQDRIIELAAIRVEPDGSEASKCWLLNPGVPIPPETTAIHGISDDVVKDCPTFADKAAEIEEFFRGCDLAGFNSDRFDVPCLEEEFARAGINFDSGGRRHVDVQRIYHKKEPRDLSAAVRFYCGRDHVGAHGAEADAKATLDVLKAQLEKYGDLPKTTAEMDEFLVPRDPLNADRTGLIRWQNGEWRINFGKKKGVSLKELFLHEQNFLKWFVKGNFETDARMIVQDLLARGVLPQPPKI
ncbi:MAG: 3'-5' exonuclease [Kiritimatiellae bacterium]|nr:3'-5' exonuclease [Kiritimatiellia bacterium]